ncbi:porin PorA family protein [Corynebacterium alimapuense]|uniref:DUF3068 domain-containing protein n=1 Tax=Corynebacterium alimapuense TaxID=1576874 RepID=A0A3M8KB06_9CORY|nr:porin PorA family protein [Corynebacterium alimapuense]RNE49975.1 hypothetical protein C5L39_00965 [Corynebacterium alimapuense]
MISFPGTWARRQRSIVILLVLAALAFMAGSFIPPLLIWSIKPIPAGVSAEFHTEPAYTVAVDPSALENRTASEANLDRPECRDTAFKDLPFSCLVTEGESFQTRITTTSQTADDEEINVDSVIKANVFGYEVAEFQDHVRLESRSAYPVAEPASSLTMSIPGVPSGIESELFVREGLQYFFPFTLERRSYEFFDVLAQEPVALDYVGETNRNGHDAYEFHQTITAVSTREAAARAFLQPTSITSPQLASGEVLFNQLSVEQQDLISGYTFSGPASRFYSEEELERFDYGVEDTVVVEPFYSVSRTVWVEPSSGIILDGTENRHVYLAADVQEAEALAFDPSRAHALYLGENTWDQQTLDIQRAAADEVVGELRALQIFSYLAKALAFLLILGTVTLILRNRTQQAAS